MKKSISDRDLSLIISDTFDKLNDYLDNFFILPSQYLRFLSKWYVDEVSSLISDYDYLIRVTNSDKEFL